MQQHRNVSTTSTATDHAAASTSLAAAASNLVDKDRDNLDLEKLEMQESEHHARLSALEHELRSRQSIVTGALWTEIELHPSDAAKKFGVALDLLIAACRDLRAEYEQEFETWRERYITSGLEHQLDCMGHTTNMHQQEHMEIKKESDVHEEMERTRKYEVDMDRIRQWTAELRWDEDSGQIEKASGA